MHPPTVAAVVADVAGESLTEYTLEERPNSRTSSTIEGAGNGGRDGSVGN